MQPGNSDPDPDGTENTHQELALRADVEQAGAETEGDGQPAQDQRRRVNERVDERRLAAQRP